MRNANNFNMKSKKNYRGRILLCAALFCCSLCCLSGCNVNKMSSLSELTKPYAGLYECESLMLGGNEMDANFEKLYLELKADGTFTLAYRGAEGLKGEYGGHYRVNDEREEITFYAYTGRRAQTFTFPMKEGRIRVAYNLGGKLLHGVFSLP